MRIEGTCRTSRQCYVDLGFETLLLNPSSGEEKNISTVVKLLWTTSNPWHQARHTNPRRQLHYFQVNNNLPPRPAQQNNLEMPPQLPTTAVLQPIRNVVSNPALYPLKGIIYFSRHREYWPLFNRRLIPLTITSIIVLVLLFMFTYLPQAAFLLIFHGPTGWVSAVFLVLGEGQLIIALLFEAFLVDEACVDVFDVRISGLSRYLKIMNQKLTALGHPHPRRIH